MKNQNIIIIAVALMMVLGLQAYIMFRLHERLDQISIGNSQKIPDSPKLGQPQSDFDDKFFDGEFFDDRPWTPYDEMRHMQEEMEQIFDKSLSHFHMNTPLGSLSKTPEVDLQEKPDHYLVTVNVPGADEASMDVKLEGQRLRISIKTEQAKDETDNKNGGYRYRERFTGEFQRALTLPGPGDANKMKTGYHNGVLTITIPKAK